MGWDNVLPRAERQTTPSPLIHLSATPRAASPEGGGPKGAPLSPPTVVSAPRAVRGSRHRLPPHLLRDARKSPDKTDGDPASAAPVSCAAASRSALRWAPTAVAVHRTASGGTTVVVVFYRIISYLLMAGGARRRQAFSLMDATASPWRPHASAADGGLFDSCELAVRPPQSRQ